MWITDPQHGGKWKSLLRHSSSVVLILLWYGIERTSGDAVAVAATSACALVLGFLAAGGRRLPDDIELLGYRIVYPLLILGFAMILLSRSEAVRSGAMAIFSALGGLTLGEEFARSVVEIKRLSTEKRARTDGRS